MFQFQTTPTKISSRKRSVPGAKPDLEEIANRKTLAALQEEICYLWSINSVDPTYQKAFLECLSKARAKLCIQFLAKEIESLEKKTSDIQQLYSSIEKREELIKRIRELNEFLWEQKLSQEVKEKVCSSSISRHENC
eukprot:TRINITY_DN5152_c0_g1_i23.p1 TRINITY_DN5152_c0_g1~~TRINITY_DN5152_c0_g1_i23.p1  ORF type:complete len:137 (+),score=21.80 TRINITY_DN5152_c0_g1_i23:208-618(+)